MTDAERIIIIERHAAELSEVYDSVQIFGSWVAPDGRTRSHKRGSVDFYARQGLAHEFIQENIAEDNARMIAQRLNPPDEYPKAQP